MYIFVVERLIEKQDTPNIGFQFMYAFKNYDDARTYCETWIKDVLVNGDIDIQYFSDSNCDFISCKAQDRRYLFRIKESKLVESYE